MTQTLVEELILLLKKVAPEDFSKSCTTLSGSSIGQHIRHSIEMYHCLMNGYENRLIDYNARKRNAELEQNINIAIQALNLIVTEINKQDITLQIESNGSSCSSSFLREILYCDEHLIHHLALVRIGIKELGEYEIPSGFGVAPSTIQYQKECVQ